MKANLKLNEKLIQKKQPLKKLNSWKIGGFAEYFTCPSSLDEIVEVLTWAKENNMNVTILGGGTNVLISDTGVKGLVLCLHSWQGIVKEELFENKLFLEVKSGTDKTDLLKTFLHHRLSSSLFLAGLPGEVGGGIITNAGVAELIEPQEFCDIVDWIEVISLPDITLKRYEKKDLDWSYRQCRGWEPGLIVKIGISCQYKIQTDISDQVRSANRLRLQKQPLDLPSCGSVFVNPPGHKAAALIDVCGLKGYRVGDAQVSLKHANFIVNLGQATSKDVLSVINYIKKTVYEIKGIELITEVRFIG